MIKCEVIENFTLEDYSKLRNVKKVINRKENEFGAKDTFECDEDMAKYLLGDNILKKTVVKVIEVEPKVDLIENEFEVRSDEVKELINEKQEELKEIIRPKKKKHK